MLRRLGAFFLDILEVIVFAVAIFLFVYLLILRPHKIKGASMEPNFPDKEYLLTEKVTYYLNEPKRGDVIVFKPPISEEDEFIKRIIGLPGESVSIESGKVSINGRVLDEPYINSNVLTSGGNFLPDGERIVVPEGEYFVVGDNRGHSSDSRTWGTVAKRRISGRAWLVYWPPQNFGFVEKADYSGFKN